MVPSVQEPRARESTIRGFVPHVPDDPSGKEEGIVLSSFFACVNMQLFYMSICLNKAVKNIFKETGDLGLVITKTDYFGMIDSSGNKKKPTCP